MGALKQHKNKIIIIGLLVIAFFVYGYFFSGSSTPESLLTSTTPVGSNSPESAEILLLLTRFEKLKIDPTVFSNSVFVSLKDFSRAVPEQKAGRSNPFAPLGRNNLSTPSSNNNNFIIISTGGPNR